MDKELNQTIMVTSDLRSTLKAKEDRLNYNG